jgi:predicted nucleotidyltransferase
MAHGQMSRHEIVRRIQSRADAIRAEGATALYLFGSVARDQAVATSDIDVFIDYDPNSNFSLLNLSGIRLIIMDEIGREVDITTSSSLHPRLKDRILAEAVRGGPGCLNRFSASISGASAGVRLPSGVAAG